MKRIRKSICRLLVLCMLVTMLPMSVFAESSEIASGTCGESLIWVLTEDGTLTISGSGEMESYGYVSHVPWYRLADKITSVVIKYGVTSIGSCAFQECTALTSITIPGSVSDIGNYAFSNCLSLNSVSLPDSVTQIGINVFDSCTNLTSVTIGNGIASISDWAFTDCDSLTSVTIGNGVISIGSWAFAGCDRLTFVTIPDGVTTIGNSAFAECYSLKSIVIPSSITEIDILAFGNCTSLAEILFQGNAPTFASSAFYGVTATAYYPESNTTWTGELMQDYRGTITWISYSGEYGGHWYKLITDEMNWIEAVEYCRSIGGHLVTITSEGENSFVQSLISESTMIGLSDVSEEGVWTWVTGEDVTYTNWAKNEPNNEANEDYALIRADGTWNDGHLQKENRVFVCEWEDATDIKLPNAGEFPELSITGLTIEKAFENFCVFLGDSAVYNMDSPNAALYLELNQIAVVDNDVISPADVVWTSSDETVLRIISSGTEEDMYVNLRVEGLAEGTVTLTATNPAGETLSFDVTVVKPNALSFANIYDTKQYYSSGAFYSAASSISDSVEIFVQFENALIDGYPCKVESDLAKNISDVEPITLTATVSGSDLSFDRNSYQNTYTTTYDPIKFGNYIYDILMLFPSNVGIFKAGTSYSVNITLESDSFTAPIEETYNFTVYDAEKQRVDEHISFINNSTYKVSKQNIYGTNMLELKDDPEYNWSVVTSLDFDNYYEIVVADLLVDMLDVYQVNTSIVPTVLKEWHGTYKSLLGDVTTMVKDSYSDVLDVSEMKIDKILKVSKYTNAGDGIYADDDVYQVVLDLFGNVGNVDKIQTFFAAVDDTKSAFSIVKLTGDVVKDFVAWGNSIAVLNAFVETDENFKQVFRQVANNIPDSDKKMKEAIEDYLNYSEDFAGQFSEIYDSFCDLGVDVALDTFDGIVGKKLWDWAAAKAVGWIGKIPISGGAATFSSTTAYASLTMSIGSVTTGISLGLCLSDLICDSSDKAAEMSKIIAMSEYAPYIIQALEYYEDNLCSAADNNAVDLFEKAFGLHQASQSYIMDHTVKALKVKGESILYQILGNDDYDRLVAEILVQKNAVDCMDCCGTLTTDTVVNNKKVIAIKCPVDVYVYSEDGSEVVCIINDGLQFAGEGITVYIRDRAKYIALPTNQTYSLKIVATDTGKMDYIVQEFDKELQLHRTVQEQNIALVDGCRFSGQIAPQLDIEETHYELNDIGLIGDFDQDDSVTDADALYLLRYTLFPNRYPISQNGDVDGDGTVTDADALYLLRYTLFPERYPLKP